jgi:hypothetical protein
MVSARDRLDNPWGPWAGINDVAHGLEILEEDLPRHLRAGWETTAGEIREAGAELFELGEWFDSYGSDQDALVAQLLQTTVDATTVVRERAERLAGRGGEAEADLLRLALSAADMMAAFYALGECTLKRGSGREGDLSRLFMAAANLLWKIADTVPHPEGGDGR